ncbi:type III polyketide synthase [Streptomyces sp. NPDC047081]|uniref:type III polyketide synthase n=1 Tax=Streptomyces sp. NPDC047081 TaxID=3154706 RepID=UPI0033E70B4F
MPVVSAPVVVLPRHQVTTDELMERIEELYADHPKIRQIRRVMRATTVRTRCYTRPLAEQFGVPSSLAERARAHLRECLDLAERAAEQALLETGLDPGEINGLVVLSSTGHSLPGLDVPLMDRLGLPRSVRRVPVSQVGCAGGVFALARALDLMAAGRDSRVLVVCVDAFSHYLHGADTGLDGMILKGLFGDAAGACVVRSEAAGPRMELLRAWEYVHPDTHGTVGTYVDGDGLHGFNSPKLQRVVREAMPLVTDWLERTAPPGCDPAPRFVVSHTGGPRILDAFVEGLGCHPDMVDLARDSLRELGNVGSVSVLDVLQRTFAKSPAEGDRGLLLAAGPGVTFVAVQAVWRSWS